MRARLLSVSSFLSVLLLGSSAIAASPSPFPLDSQCSVNVDHAVGSPSCVDEYEELVRAFEQSEQGQKLRAEAEARSVQTVAVKKAIRWALRNRSAIIRTAENWFGKANARRLDNVFDRIYPVLNDLLRYQDLVWGNIQGQLTPIIGADLAYWVTQIIQFASPV